MGTIAHHVPPRPRAPSRPHPAPLYYYISQTGCVDPGYKKYSKSYYFWDPGWTRVGPGSDPGRTRATKSIVHRITFGTQAGPGLDPGWTRVGPGSDAGYKKYSKSYYFWDPGWTRVGPGSDPAWTQAAKIILNRITFGTQAGRRLDPANIK